MTENNKNVTRHIVIDIHTGRAYGVALNEKSECTAVQPLNQIVLNDEFKPVLEVLTKNAKASRQPAMGGAKPGDKDELPFGATTFGVELTKDGKSTGEIFTIVWPTKEEAEKGKLPAVGRKEMPKDLVKAGIAAFPDVLRSPEERIVEQEEELRRALENIDKMIGLNNAKKDLKQNIALARFKRAKEQAGLDSGGQSLHMVFTGNPGTGKTTFAREVAKVLHALGFIQKPSVTEVTRVDLVAGYVGQTAIKTQEKIDEAKGGILFIDEAYALSNPSKGGQGADFGKEAIDTLVAAMENNRDNMVVIVAGYPEPMKKFIDANEGLKSRFLTYIEFEDYDMNDLGQILDVMLKDRGYTMDPEAREHAMNLIEEEKDRNKKAFGNGRTVRNLVEKAEKEMALRLDEEGLLKSDNTKDMSMEDIKKSLTTISLKDVQAVDLAGINDKHVSDGFNFSAKPDVANDDKAPAAGEPAVKDAPQARKKKNNGPKGYSW